MTKQESERFSQAFRSLKHQIDMIPLTAYQREELLRYLNEMRMTYEQLKFIKIKQ